MTPEAAEAVARADAAADPRWIDAASRALRSICAVRGKGAEVTSDAVWATLERQGVKPPREPRAVAAVFVRAASAGLIRKTDRVRQSVRRECHGRPVTVWEVCR